MISIIVHLPLRGCLLRCYFSMNIIVNNFQDKWKGTVIPMWRLFRQANWNETTCYWLGQRRSKDDENNSAYLCLLLTIKFLSWLCRRFFSQINSAEECHLMMNFEKKIHFTVFKIFVKMQIWWTNPYKMWFFGRSVTQIIFQEICSSGAKQTTHKVSVAFIVKNCHPRTSLNC